MIWRRLARVATCIVTAVSRQVRVPLVIALTWCFVHMSIDLFGSDGEEVRFVVDDVYFSGGDDELVDELIHGVTPILLHVELKPYVLGDLLSYHVGVNSQWVLLQQLVECCQYCL
jgi:hypothetical protein